MGEDFRIYRIEERYPLDLSQIANYLETAMLALKKFQRCGVSGNGLCDQ